ncbi:leuA [Symbiodinium pilosum]|uniref:LeuA protein n=1 Tax=Symbiodinium pilosum TaxID=2952 RepID=A0A812RDG7_SYMPI|nr:leuA [Symbiodinium pilosum]
MAQGRWALLALIQVAICPLSVIGRSDGFVVEKKGLRARNIDVEAFKAEVRNAMDEALGCGGEVSEKHLQATEEVLHPMFITLPKNGNGRLERRSLRYLVYRYFHRKSALVIRGFEPTRLINESTWGAADILSEQVPGFVESVLQSSHLTESGFDLRDAAYMVATLEQLIFDSESALLEKVYNLQHKPLSRMLSEQGLQQLLEAYIAVWMAGDDIVSLLGNNRELAQVFPHWDQLLLFARGQISALDYQRENNPKLNMQAGGNALLKRYSFDDAHAVVGEITKSFASYWESECRAMKQKLVSLDKRRTGRVPLSKFYGKSLTDAEWRFGESESYLRELGALDETSWLGKQVIISNYIQGASNCIVTASHYSVCCINECEPIMAEIEEAVKGPLAEPDFMLSLVGNMTALTTLEDEVDVHLDESLVAQLTSIAKAHGGKVPIHGRLFAQWLHYVFPRDCSFPHKSGAAQSLSPTQFGDGYLASDDEMEAHAKDTKAEIPLATMKKEELQWMSQWSEDEELIASYSGLLASPSAFGFQGGASKTVILLGFGLFMLAALIGGVSFNRKVPNQDFLLPSASGKTHFV